MNFLSGMPTLSTHDAIALAVCVGVGIAAYVLWFLWTMRSYQFNDEDFLRQRKGAAGR